METRQLWVKLRKHYKVSARTVSDVSGVSYSMISKYERGITEISVKNLERMLDVIDYKIRFTK